MRTSAIALAALSLAAVAAPAAQAAPPRFDVELSGVQTTTWEKHHISEGGCDVPMDGSGAETYRFRSQRLRVQAIRSPGGVLIVAGRGPALLRLSGTVTRSGHILVGPGEICSEGDGTGTPPPPPPDCGTKRVKGAVEIGFSTRPSDLLVISDGLLHGSDVFRNCPTGASDQFPALLGADDHGRRIGRRLPARDLFTHGQNIVLARGTKSVTNGELTSTTTIRWSASFKRVTAPARASTSPPVSGGVKCQQRPRSSYKLANVARQGLAVRITCDGPATFFAVPELRANTPQERELTDLTGHGTPAISSVRRIEMKSAGTVTVRPRITPLGLRVMRHYPKTKLKIGLGTLREDGNLWSDPGDWSYAVVVR
jgi:hypothetical protein